MTTVMVTSAGRRRYLLEELVRTARPGDIIIATDMDPLAPALSTPGVRPIVVEGSSIEERSDRLMRLAEANRVDALLSLHDFETIELSAQAHRLETFGCLFIGPSVATSRLCLDKLALADHLGSLDASLTPRTYARLDELRTVAHTSRRWVVKDRWGSASSGLTFCDCQTVVTAAEQFQKDSWVAQPMSEGIEYNVDLFKAPDGSVAGTCVKRKWAMRGGETDSASVLPAPPAAVLDAAVRAVSRLDVTGNVDVDVISGPDGDAVVIDVNPRFGGGFAFSALAGYRAAAAIWELARRDALSPMPPCRDITASKYIAVTETIPEAP